MSKRAIGATWDRSARILLSGGVTPPRKSEFFRWAFRVSYVITVFLWLSAGQSERLQAQISTINSESENWREEATEQGFSIGTDLNLGTPLSGFANTMDRVGFGATFQGGYQLKNRPVMFGLDLGFLNFGRDSRNEAFSLTIPDATVLVENTYNLMHSSFLVRLVQPVGEIRPYFEGAIGFNYLYTETTIENTNTFLEEPVFRSTNFDDFAFSYGAVAGLLIELHRYPVTDILEGTTRIERVMLNLMGRYKAGGTAEYLKKGSITVQNGQAFYDVSRSKTDLFYYTVGVLFMF